MNINAKNFGLAAGILWGLVMLILTLISVSSGYATNFLNIIAGIYPGYEITYAGSLIGFAYGFVDAFVGGYLLIWLYNKLEKK